MIFLPGVPEKNKAEIVAAMQRPDGTVLLHYNGDLLQQQGLTLKLAEVVAGQHHFLLERTQDNQVAYFYSSPGTGTRVARVSLEPLRGAPGMLYCFSWSPELTRLTLANPDNPEVEFITDGEPSRRMYRVGPDGSVFQIGDDSVQILAFSVFEGTKEALQPTAIEAWRETVDAVRLILIGDAPNEHDYATVKGNLALVMLVTGFETYCKRRFLEVEGEGVQPDFTGLAGKFLSTRERDAGEIAAIEKEAADNRVSPTSVLIKQGRVDFQNYDRCKTAYNKGYGIKFGELQTIEASDFETVQRTIRHRHRIVHVSPKTAWLNQPYSPPEDPIMAGPETARMAADAFDRVVRALHQATLNLRPASDSEPEKPLIIERPKDDLGGEV